MLRVLLTLALVAAVVTPSASAAWQRVSSQDLAVTTQPAFLRMGDGTLHVVWIRPQDPLADYVNTRLKPNGRLGTQSVVLNDWTYLNNPKLIRGPSGGLRLVFDGQRNSEPKTNQRGLYARQIAPTAGSRLPVPDSANGNRSDGIVQPIGRTEITGRLGGADGVYMAYCAYPSCGSVRLWRVGGTSSRVVARGTGFGTHASIAAGPNGRLWVLWTVGNRVFARRSNPSASTFGAVVKVGPPRGTIATFQLDAEGSRGPLDVFVNVATTSGSAFRQAIWHKRLYPGLTLTASPKRFGNDRARTVAFKVRDAGRPVDATVKVAGRTLRTGADGNVTTTFARGFREGRYKARATAPGYTADSVTLRVT